MDRTPPLERTESAILFVDDDKFDARPYVLSLTDAGYNVTYVATADEALTLATRQQFAAAVVDIMMAPGPELHPIDTAGGLRTGLALARHLRAEIPHIKIVGLSNMANDPDVQSWFASHDSTAFLPKRECLPHDLVNCVNRLLRRQKQAPQVFIVHGRDRQTMLDLKNFIQNALHLGEPIILAEQPSRGQTIIEKFEEYANRIDIAFVILTPDDVGALAGSEAQQRRARQNVIFELGYFLGTLGRRKGRVILLKNSAIEIPSDIHGLVHIDISQGIEAAGEEIRRELREWL